MQTATQTPAATTPSFFPKNPHAPATERQKGVMDKFGIDYAETVTAGEASLKIDAFKLANPDVWAEHQAANDAARKQRQAERRTSRPQADAAAESRPTPVLDGYVAAAEAKATARPGFKPATRGQIREVQRLAYLEATRDQDRINALTALKGGISFKHASTLIGMLSGKYQPAQP